MMAPHGRVPSVAHGHTYTAPPQGVADHSPDRVPERGLTGLSGGTRSFLLGPQAGPGSF